jgi:flagellar motor component MotA
MIDLKIPDEIMQKAVTDAVTKGIEKGVADWEVARAVAEAARDAVNASGLIAAVSKGVKDAATIKAEEITTEVVASLGPAIAAAMRSVLVGALADFVLAATEPATYGHDKQSKRVALLKEWGETGARRAS